ncbi:MAG: hypothetical protein PHO57_10695 [Acidithiobacillus sp.]|jgi:hypothetical protein|nr:hypothetical protein [Acidithiobacillus sp.]
MVKNATFHFLFWLLYDTGGLDELTGKSGFFTQITKNKANNNASGIKLISASKSKTVAFEEKTKKAT